MADEERLLKILLRYVTDVKSVEQAKAAAAKLTEAEKAVGKAGLDAGQQVAAGAAFAEARMALLEKRTRLVIREVERLNRQAEALSRTSRTIAGTGALIAGPLVAAATAYVTQAGRAEDTSRKWSRATERISDAYQDIGRVSARDILPYLERAADLAETLAGLAERHPDAVRAALGIGGGLLALGTLGTLAAQGIRLYADVKLLAAAALQNTAADKMLLAAQGQAGVAAAGRGAGVGGVGAAGAVATALPLVGVVAAVFAAQQYLGWRAARGEFGPGPGVVARGAVGNPDMLAGIVSTAVGGVIGRVLGPLTQAVIGLNRALGILPTRDANARNTNALQSRAPGPRIGSLADALPLFIAYQQQLATAEKDYGLRRVQIVQDYVARGIALEQDYQEQRGRLVGEFAKSQGRALRDFLQNESRTQRDHADRTALQLRDFAQNEQRAEASYYQQRLQRARDFDLETQRAEEDHQARLRQFQDDHADRARDLAGAQDALGLVKEQRRYEKERRQAEEEYAKTARRRNEDYGRELADREEAFREQREQRLVDFEQQQADQKEQFQKDRAERLADFRQRRTDERNDFNERLADLAAQHDKTKAQNDANFEATLRDLDTQHRTEKDRLKADFVERLNDLDAALLGEQKKRQEYYRRMAIDLEDFLRAVRDHREYKPRREEQYPGERLVPDNQTQKRSAAGSAALTVNFDNAFAGAPGRQLVENVKAIVEQQLTAAFDQFATQMGNA